MDALARVLAFARTGKRDWVFVGFVLAASAALSNDGLGRWRYRSALEGVSVCAASGDLPCAEAALSRAESIAPKDRRTRIAQAQVAILRRDEPSAFVALSTILNRRPVGGTSQSTFAVDAIEALAPDERVAVQLVLGDIDARRNDTQGAEAWWRRAEAHLGDSALIAPRRARHAAGREPVVEDEGALLDDLRVVGNEMVDAALAGDTAGVNGSKARLAQLLPRLRSGEARGKMHSAMTAAENALLGSYATGELSDPRPPPARPTAPSDTERDDPGAWEEYRAKAATYREDLDRWKRANEAWTRRPLPDPFTTREALIDKDAARARKDISEGVAAEAMARLDGGAP